MLHNYIKSKLPIKLNLIGVDLREVSKHETIHDPLFYIPNPEDIEMPPSSAWRPKMKTLHHRIHILTSTHTLVIPRHEGSGSLRIGARWL